MDFLSLRHIEMLYATLTAWGMHRMGDKGAKLVSWKQFAESVRNNGEALSHFRGLRMLQMSDAEYSGALRKLQSVYRSLDLTESSATVVVNSKALYHLLPELVPPIDRQHTVRFFTQSPELWRNARGGWSTIWLPSGIDAQYEVFCRMCEDIKCVATSTYSHYFQEQERVRRVSAPKAIDNAIVNYVRIVDAEWRRIKRNG